MLPLGSTSGQMSIGGEAGSDKVFYSTGQLIPKAVEMGIPVLISRSVTGMGLEVAQRYSMTLIGRANNDHLLVFNGSERIEFEN